MSRKIIYFVNPISGTRRKEILIKRIEERTGAKNIPFEILLTNAAGNYFFLKEKISSENITDIVICGGDGTINKVVRSLIDEDVNIGIIPMGSGNGLAFTAKIPNNIDRALDIIFSGRAAYIDSFFINATFSCMLCGLGFDAQVAHDFALQPKRGLWPYIKQTINNLINIRSWPFEIIHKGVSFPATAFFISVANSNQFGNQFTIAPAAKLHDGRLDIVVVKEMSRYRFACSVLRQVRKGKVLDYDENTFKNMNVLYFQTDKLIINNPGEAPLHVDGDPAPTSKKFVISIIPDAFKLIQPV